MLLLYNRTIFYCMVHVNYNYGCPSQSSSAIKYLVPNTAQSLLSLAAPASTPRPSSISCPQIGSGISLHNQIPTSQFLVLLSSFIRAIINCGSTPILGASAVNGWSTTRTFSPWPWNWVNSEDDHFRTLHQNNAQWCVGPGIHESGFKRIGAARRMCSMGVIASMSPSYLDRFRLGTRCEGLRIFCMDV